MEITAVTTETLKDKAFVVIRGPQLVFVVIPKLFSPLWPLVTSVLHYLRKSDVAVAVKYLLHRGVFKGWGKKVLFVGLGLSYFLRNWWSSYSLGLDRRLVNNHRG